MTPLTIGLSVLGLAPFIVFGLGSLGATTTADNRMLGALIDYAALVLAFTGGVHWGLALEPREDAAAGASTSAMPGQPVGQRLLLGAGALAIGWIALLMAHLLAPWMALLVLIAGYVAAMVVEHHRRAWLPPQWVWVRWGFTVVAVAMLTTVLTLRLLGQTIVL